MREWANEQPVKFATTISSAADIENACEQKQTVLQYKPQHKVSQQYRELTEEIEQRIEEHRKLSAPTVAGDGQAPTEVANG